MPLLDIPTSKSCFQNHICKPGARTLLHNRIVFGNDKNLFQVPEKEKNFHVAHVGVQRGVLLIRAVATIEPKYSIRINGEKSDQKNHWPNVVYERTLEKEYQYTDNESEEVGDKEILRRKRISKANSGKTPWNKGRKHSAETKQRIKERTRIAMQSPKVKMKLANIGHSQSEETRMRIGVSVRTMWEKRREKLMVQERCHFEWQDLIADAFRRGFNEDEELQWNSYEILDEELEQEWFENIEQRKQMPRSQGHKRAPKSLEQRRKIAAAISAKWADSAYRDRVVSAQSKYHGSPARAERQPRKRPTVERQREPRTPKPTKKPVKIVKGAESHKTRLRRKTVPSYKDPLASSKLEMIKNIRAQRVAAGTKKSQAFEQAKLLIARAERAATALEAAALSSPLARASLSETRNLIAEAIRAIQTIEVPQTDSYANDGAKIEKIGVNGSVSIEAFEDDIKDLSLSDFNFKELVKGETSSSFNGNSKHRAVIPNGAHSKFKKEKTNSVPITASKKWVCGRLVEV